MVLEASSIAAAQVAAVLTDGCCCCWQREREGLLLLLRPKPPSSSCCCFACLPALSLRRLILNREPDPASAAPQFFCFFSKNSHIFHNCVPWLARELVSTPSDALLIALRHTQHKYLIRMSAQLVRGAFAKVVIVLLDSIGKSTLWSDLQETFSAENFFAQHKSICRIRSKKHGSDTGWIENKNLAMLSYGSVVLPF